MRLPALFLLLVAIPIHAATLHAKVVGVADGDSLYVRDDENREYKVRLQGIDAPELKQAFGDTAKVSLKLLLQGQPVDLKWQKRDQYGRLLAKVTIGQTDAALYQVKAGLAWWNKKYAHEQSTADVPLYRDAEFVARKKRLGLWSQINPLPPWRWRYANPRQNDTVKP